jgi:hypothetical protein
MGTGTTVVGEDFDRIRLAFAQADGDEEGCPFDTPDDPYTGPSLAYSGGRWNIVPSEFPPEFFLMPLLTSRDTGRVGPTATGESHK